MADAVSAFMLAHPVLLGGTGALWLCWLTLSLVHLVRQSPRHLEAELLQMRLEHADLVDRFVRFQKRDLMRNARDSGPTSVERAFAILSQQPPPQPTVESVPPEGSPEFKSWLRRRANRSNP
jgi:hypothetical protein